MVSQLCIPTQERGNDRGEAKLQNLIGKQTPCVIQHGAKRSCRIS
uniref:Uncharacterized protein n=1 Tax=Candidatus Kentrum sp. SD TaxID=2126332 RepID=A0A451BSZ4_9GAMM|nr:MAG: hypothetical protein BECKSD772D_GA0070982_13101 [Candidatus Kentron sp. SD]